MHLWKVPQYIGLKNKNIFMKIFMVMDLSENGLILETQPFKD